MQAILFHMASAQTDDAKTAIALYAADQDAASPHTSAAVVMPQIPTTFLARLPEVHDHLWQLSSTNGLWPRLQSQVLTSASTALVLYSPSTPIVAEDICPLVSSATAVAVRPSLWVEVSAAPEASTAVALRTPLKLTTLEGTCSFDDSSTTLVLDPMAAVTDSAYHAELSTAVALFFAPLPVPTELTTGFFGYGEMTTLTLLPPQTWAGDGPIHSTKCCNSASMITNFKSQKPYDAFFLRIQKASSRSSLTYAAKSAQLNTSRTSNARLLLDNPTDLYLKLTNAS